jgi:hypothetical protein
MSETLVIEVNGLTKTSQVGDVFVHALRDPEIRKGEL